MADTQCPAGLRLSASRETVTGLFIASSSHVRISPPLPSNTSRISYDVIDDDPPRTWVFGFTPKGTLVEMIVLHKAKEDLVIHCMKARKGELDKALHIAGGRY